MIRIFLLDIFELEDGEKIELNNLEYKFIKPLIWW